MIATTTRRVLVVTAATTLLWAAPMPAAQEPAPAAPAPAAPPAPAPQLPPGVLPPAPGSTYPRILLTTGRSTILSTPFALTRIAITNPAIADATVVQQREVLIDGKGPGTVSLIVWGSGSDRAQYDVVVDTGESTLQQKMQALFPGEDIEVSLNDEAIILSGHVSSNAVSLRAAEIAAATTSKAKVVNLLQLPGGSQSQQVLLQVRFAEVTHNAAMQLGASIFTSATGVKNTVGRITTQQVAAPGFTGLEATKVNSDFGSSVTSASGTLTFSDFLNIFIFSEKYDIGAMIKALQTKGLIQSLAEPNLIAYNGQPASFLAGGEIPVPVVQGGAGGSSGSVTVQYKEFGIRLDFTPTIAGDTIRLKVKPEVSALDFTNAVVLQGFRIPALTTRRAETSVELRDGQSFAIAGLLNNSATEDTSAIPAISKLPIIGALFKAKATDASRTELMVLITPRLVRPLNPDEVPPLPTLPGKFLPEDIGGQMQGGGGVVDAPPAEHASAGAAAKSDKGKAQK